MEKGSLPRQGDTVALLLTKRRDENPTSDGNIRDMANVHELICISNLENINALLIEQGMSQENRLIKLNQLAIQQMTILIKSNSKQSALFKK